MPESKRIFLSKVGLSWSATRNPYEWHRALWQLFPERPDAERDFLFRVERQHPGQGSVVLLQSRQAPIKDSENAELLAEPKEIKLATIREGTIFRFRLNANVIKTIADAEDHERRVRVPLLNEAEQTAWLKRKFAGAAELLDVSAQGSGSLYFKQKGRAGKIVTVMFDGVLRVMDHAQFSDLVINGIGPAKAFGCGMLSLARI